MTTARIRGKAEPLLNDFALYCINHPEERFWQALRNWSGYSFIYGADTQVEAQIKQTWPAVNIELKDTFALEGKRHDSKESKSSS